MHNRQKPKYKTVLRKLFRSQSDKYQSKKLLPLDTYVNDFTLLNI